MVCKVLEDSTKHISTRETPNLENKFHNSAMFREKTKQTPSQEYYKMFIKIKRKNSFK